MSIEHADGRRSDLPGKANVRLTFNDLVVVESCGGGGYGAPEAGSGPESAPVDSARRREWLA